MWECFVACRTSSATWFSSGTYREVRLWSGPSPNCCTLRWRRSSGPNYCPRPRTALSRSDKHSLYVYWSIFYGKGEANKTAIVFLTVVLFYEFGKILDLKTVADMNFVSFLSLVSLLFSMVTWCLINWAFVVNVCFDWSFVRKVYFYWLLVVEVCSDWSVGML